MNPEITCKLENIRESLEWFEDSANNNQWHAALRIIEDVARQVEALRSEVEDRSNEGN